MCFATDTDKPILDVGPVLSLYKYPLTPNFCFGSANEPKTVAVFGPPSPIIIVLAGPALITGFGLILIGIVFVLTHPFKLAVTY